MEDVLTVALEPKVAGLNHTRVNRSDRDFVDFLALHSIEVRHSHERLLVIRPFPGVVAWPQRLVKADRLEPRMSLGTKTELLGDLALEQMSLRAFGCQGVEFVVLDARRRDIQYAG